MSKPDDSNRSASYFQNWLSVLGGIGSIFFSTVILFLIIVTFVAKESNPYLFGITYLILPGFLIVFLLMIPVGALHERKRRLRNAPLKTFPKIDFNNTTHQRWALVGISVVTIFILFSMFGAYRAYQFTESTEFCGKLCHKIMEPEYTAYQHSPHARVDCVACHIGPGADWYVRSKISGAYQVYATIFNKFPTPVETPVKNLRPAQETCEQCHWPQQFYGAIEEDKHYFLPDEKNSEWKTRMLMFVGGGTPPYGKGEGIHWHMNIKNKVFYVTEDEKRLTIPWVKKIGPDGKEEIFVNEESEYKADNPPKGEMRKMDCIDCHNRPSHIYNAPSDSVNAALSAGEIDKSLPYIKREAVKSLVEEYASHEAADKGIRERIENFYKDNYPQVWSASKAAVKRSADAIVDIYKRNFFPFMKVNWKQYPNHIGHMNFDGCFRCHDGKHKSESGKVITNDCKACHNIVSQGNPNAPETVESSIDGLEFKHPEDIGDSWKEESCTTCHTGELA